MFAALRNCASTLTGQSPNRFPILFLTPAVFLIVASSRLAGVNQLGMALVLFAAVVLTASVAGLRVGLLNAVPVAAYLIYTYTDAFGPDALLHDRIRLLLVCGAVVAVPVFIGQLRDRKDHLIGALRDAEESLERSRQDLESIVELRTRQVADSNAALTASEDRLKRAQRIANVGCWDWQMDRNELWWSDEIYRIFGIDRDNFEANYEAFLERVHPEDRQLVDEAVRRALENQETYSVDHRVILQDGTEKTVHEEAEISYDASGRPVRMIGTVHDITRQVKEEKKLRQALAEIRVLRDRLEAENVRLREEVRSVRGFEEIIGDSEPLRHCLHLVAEAAPTDASILILGETGTGKELVAKAIHQLSARRDGRMVSLNCTALPSDLVESELFGHERGAFTGASARREGRFEAAHGGTLFLDEIGDLPLELQGKLLRVLQDGTFERVGGEETIQVDVRVIAAANRDLHQAVTSGAFRADLYYRISTVPIELPPLRERKEDIPLLAQHFIRKHGPRFNKAVNYISASMLTYLQAQDWPGNIRELEHAIERALIASRGDTLTLGDYEYGRPGHSAGPLPAADSTSADLQSVERAHIISVLQETNWTISGESGAAVRLQLPPSTLRSKMKRLGIARTH